MSFVVTVSFKVNEAARAGFLRLAVKNADVSLEVEEGCHQFDVCADEDEIFLYEIYTSRAAFDAHLTSDHFMAFDVAVSDMVLQKTVRTYERVRP